MFTRAQLLQEVWGYDYYGGTRTVDVHRRHLAEVRTDNAEEFEPGQELTALLTLVTTINQLLNRIKDVSI